MLVDVVTDPDEAALVSTCIGPRVSLATARAEEALAGWTPHPSVDEGLPRRAGGRRGAVPGAAAGTGILRARDRQAGGSASTAFAAVCSSSSELRRWSISVAGSGSISRQATTPKSRSPM